MSSVYERLADAFDPDEDPYVVARRNLEILRLPDASLQLAGVSEAVWISAVDALLRAADAFDKTAAEAAAAQRRAAWDEKSMQLARLGCRLWQSPSDKDAWRIAGPGVDLDVHLGSGEIDGLSEGPWDMRDAFRQLTTIVEKDISRKKTAVAEKARLANLRKDHTWIRPRKVWVPKSGDGPEIAGGGTVIG